MRLTTFTDYCLRVLIYVGSKGDDLATIDEIATGYGISRSHLMKVVYRLGQLGYLTTVRGKGGGMRLARAPDEINLGLVVRQAEDDMVLAECFIGERGVCRIEPACVLRNALDEALKAFLAVLDGYTLADLLAPRAAITKLLGIPDRPGAGAP
ncbi:MAG: Rrf2 family transcriptional regulator [Alphaproteobacteria bacterium]